MDANIKPITNTIENTPTNINDLDLGKDLPAKYCVIQCAYCGTTKVTLTRRPAKYCGHPCQWKDYKKKFPDKVKKINRASFQKWLSKEENRKKFNSYQSAYQRTHYKVKTKPDIKND
jgi:hypothetical protein